VDRDTQKSRNAKNSFWGVNLDFSKVGSISHRED